MPELSLPHIGWPPTRSIPAADAHSITSALVLAMSVTIFPCVWPASCAKTSLMERIGAPMTTTSAMSATLGVGARAGDDAAVQGFAQRPGVRVAANDHGVGPRLFQSEGERRTHEPEPDHRNCGHFASYYASCFAIESSRRRRSAISRSKFSKSSDCAPSDSAWLGDGCTSTIRP